VVCAVQNVTLTMGLLTPLTWPAVLVDVLSHSRLSAEVMTPDAKAALKKLQALEYAALSPDEKLLLLRTLCDLASDCSAISKVRRSAAVRAVLTSSVRRYSHSCVAAVVSLLCVAAADCHEARRQPRGAAAREDAAGDGAGR
jgi:hypothetical protein